MSALENVSGWVTSGLRMQYSDSVLKSLEDGLVEMQEQLRVLIKKRAGIEQELQLQHLCIEQMECIITEKKEEEEELK